MPYGSSSLGSSSLGGVAAAQGVLFFATEVLPDGIHRRSLEYTGDASFFQIESRLENAPIEERRIVRVYSHNDPSESPQLQVTVGVDAFYTQSIVGAARFIVVDLELLADFSPNPIEVTITGSEYFQ